MTTTTRPLVLTVTEAGNLLGVGRSTAYELVRSGDLASLRLRRRIVVPVAHLAERLGVTSAEVWRVVNAVKPEPSQNGMRKQSARRLEATAADEVATLF